MKRQQAMPTSLSTTQQKLAHNLLTKTVRALVCQFHPVTNGGQVQEGLSGGLPRTCEPRGVIERAFGWS